MRTKAGEKEKLRAEILKDSIQTFKKHGHAGAPVDQIMKKAGLTSGALYSHFKGKDDLFFQAAQMDLDNLIERYQEMISKGGQAGLKKIIDEYLSVDHLNHADVGCLFASLGADIHRAAGKKGKSEFGDRFDKLASVFSSAMSKGTAAEKNQKAMQLFSHLIGSMTIARMLPQDSAEDVLKNAREQAYRITSISL